MCVCNIYIHVYMLELSHVEDSRQSLSRCRSRGLQMCTMRFQLVGLPATSRENNQFDDFTWKVQSPSNQIISLESLETIISVDGEASELSLSRHMCTALIMLIPTPMAMKGAWADFPTANKQYLLTFQSETCEKTVCFCFIKNCLLYHALLHSLSTWCAVTMPTASSIQQNEASNLWCVVLPQEGGHLQER